MNCLLVFLGGGFGALIRYLLSFIFSGLNCAFPYCTLTANFLGCFIASAVFTFFIVKSGFNPMYKTLLITGFCGGLSTLSALSLEVMEFVQAGAYIKALIYILISLLICIISVILGILLVRKYV